MRKADFTILSLLLLFVLLHLAVIRVSGNFSFLKPKYYPIVQIKYFHFGFSSVIADLHWLRVLQDIDYCENENVPKAFNAGVGVDSVLAANLKPSRCNKGWVFQHIDLITELSPRFRRVYRLGAEMLSVAVDDREGARLIFDKGLRQFPDYWELAYSASYHYLFEFQNPGRAAELLYQAAESGGPFWFKQMAGTLFTKAGRFVMAESVLRKYIDEHKGINPTDRAEMRLRELQDQVLKEKSSRK